MKRTAMLTGLFLCTLVAPAGAAFEPLDVRRGAEVMSDHERHVVVPRADGSLQVLDDRGPAPDLVPPRCPGDERVPRLAGLGGGLALFACPQGQSGSSQFPVIVDLATRTRQPVVGWTEAERWSGSFGTSPGAVGRHWLQVFADGAKGGWTFYLNWRNGATLQDPPREDRRDVVPDLDAPPFFRPLCAGLRRGIGSGYNPMTGYEDPEWTLDAFRGRYALTRRLTARPRLDRCGWRRPRVIRGADRYSVQLAPGRLTWRQGDRLVVEPLRRGARRVHLALPDAGDGAHVVQTRERIYWFGTRGGWVAPAPRR